MITPMASPPPRALCTLPCQTCAKEGLPLLLSRYAVLPAQAKLPRLMGPLSDPELDRIGLGEGAHYGLRLLRSGYVYVHDEARKHWDEYFVTEDGYLTKLPPRLRAFRLHSPISTQFRCARNGAAPLAGVITIAHPKHATRVWIGFSDVQWTDAVLERHQEPAVRQRHMVCITLRDGKVQPQAHTAPIEQVEQWLPEFRLTPQAGLQHFGAWCPYPFNSRHAARHNFLHAIAQARPGGGAAIVALHDPVGLAQEIAALMQARKTHFMNDPSVAMPHFAASSIASLESAVKEQARLQEIDAAQQLAAHMIGHGGLANVLPSYQHMVAQVAQPSAAQLNQAAQRRWARYTHTRTGQLRVDQAASQAWMQRHEQQQREFQARHIHPLAQAHAAWMQHRFMSSQLNYNHDRHDPACGAAYTAIVAELLRYTTDEPPCHELYLRWLTSGQYAEDNLVMRAIGFNQAELIQQLQQAEAQPVDGRAYPSDALMSAVAAFMEHMPAGARAHLAKLLAGLSGAALKYWDDFNAGKVGGRAAAALAAVSGRQFVRVPIVGNKGQFIQAYMSALYRLDPELKVKPNELQAAIAKQVRLLQIQGVKTNAAGKLGWYVVLRSSPAVLSWPGHTRTGYATS
jgi:hypothetical protein